VRGGGARFDCHLAAAARVGEAVERLGATAAPGQNAGNGLLIFEGDDLGRGGPGGSQGIGNPCQGWHGLGGGQQVGPLTFLPLEGTTLDLEGEQCVQRGPPRASPVGPGRVFTQRQQALDAVGGGVGVRRLAEL